MTLRAAEIVLVRMAFHQTSGAKIRPALVMLDSGDDDFVAAPVTSRQRSTAFDVPIEHWQAAGLNVPSWVRLHKLAVLPKADVVRSLGVCDQTDREALRSVACRAYCPS